MFSLDKKGLRDFIVIIVGMTGEIRPPDKMCKWKKKSFYHFSTKIYAVGTQKNHLNETFLLEPKNRC